MMNMIRWFVGGAIIAILFWTFVVLTTWLFAEAMGQEVSTRESTLGEQNRSLNYVAPSTITQEYIIYESPAPIDTSEYDCAQTNRKLLAMVEMIAEQIARQPHTGHVYAQALTTIRGLWCDQ